MQEATTQRTLKQAREALDLTQERVSNITGFSVDTITRMENGQTKAYSCQLYAEWLQHYHTLNKPDVDFDFSLGKLIPDVQLVQQGPGEGDE